jgi:acyl CoA:acetate/3-ketoacid CoA transferase alpha subunit
MNKFMTAADMVAQLKSGMTIGVGGWGPRRKPMALIREIVRSDLKDLTIVAYGGADIGMLCAAGKVKKAIYGFVSLDAIPVEQYFRKSRQAGEIEVCEVDEGNLLTGLRAAGQRLPFLPTRVGLGTDVMTYNPDFKTIKSPYADGEIFLAMPALNLDVALLHADRGDKLGNTQTEGPDVYFDDVFARAAEKAYVSCEEVYDRLDQSHPEGAKNNLYERYLVTGVIHAPCGAHPSSYPSRYGWDMDHFKKYAASAAEEGGWTQYKAEFIDGGEAAYLEKVGGAERVKSLKLPIF